MILLELTSDVHKSQFADLLQEARKKKGSRFREHCKARISQIQLMFGRLYGLFDEKDNSYEQMLAGFCLHALDEFGESFAVPELTFELKKYAPHTIFEAGQLWSTDLESTLALRTGCSIVLSILHAQALLIYPVIIPRDSSLFYPNFRRIGSPFSVPFAQTLRGENIWLQAMLLDGIELIREFEVVAKAGFETQEMHSIIRFNLDASVKIRRHLSDPRQTRKKSDNAGESIFSTKSNSSLAIVKNPIPAALDQRKNSAGSTGS